jgi:hypothetical protein
MKSPISMNTAFKRLLGAAVLFGLSSFCFAYGVAPTHWCGPAARTGWGELVLTGHIDRKMIWGPPNFGGDPKNDQRYSVWILSLDYPVPVLIGSEFQKGTRSSVKLKVTRISQIQLETTNRIQSDELVAQLNRVTVISGTLWTAETPAESTQVIMHISNIDPPHTLPPSCDGKLLKSPI